MATPLRAVRVPDDVWQHAQAYAAEHGVSVSELIVGFLAGLGGGMKTEEGNNR